MSPAMQTFVVALVVAGALLYVGRRVWKTMAAARRAKAGCGDGCCK